VTVTAFSIGAPETCASNTDRLWARHMELARIGAELPVTGHAVLPLLSSRDAEARKLVRKVLVSRPPD